MTVADRSRVESFVEPEETNGEMRSALAVISRAEIDIQIATAHQFPRSMAVFKRRAIEMATLDEDTAASCIYSRPVGEGKFAEGLSVRMAEIVGASYGNLRVGAMLIEQTERYVKARGFAHDLETNFASASEVIESTVDKYGRPYSERMRVVVAKACVAKARRDATFQVVPKALCRPVEIEARKVALGDASTLANRRSQVMDWIKKLGIDPSRVFAALNVTGEADIGLDQLATLTGLKTAIRDGDTTVDEAFPAPMPEAAERAAGSGPLQERVNQLKKKAAPTPPPETVNTSTGEVATGAPADDSEQPEPPPASKDPKAAYKAFVTMCEQAAQNAGWEPDAFDKAYATQIVKLGIKGREHTITNEQMDAILEDIKNGAGCFARAGK